MPLSARAVSILKPPAKIKTGDFVFSGQARGKPLSNMALEMMLRRMKIDTALAHVIGDKAEQASRRSDALEKRRKLMDAWANFCEPKATSNVVELRKR